MDIQELLKWTDDRILANTGKHLDSLQKAILEGIWQHQNYEKIAATHHRTYHHVKREAWKLWKILSETLGEDVKKSNVISVLETQILSNNFYPTFEEQMQIVGTLNGNINICGENGIASPTPDSSEGKGESPIIDLKDAPELIDYCEEHRSSELAQLGEWISAGTRLIAIYGLSGIGKSAIAVNLVAETSSKFDCVIWRSLTQAPTLSAFKTELKQFFAPLQPTPLARVSDYFRNYRCLLVLDDLENIFQSGQLAGQYSSGYEGYGKFFKQIATSSSSCLILLGWEKPRDIASLEGERRSARSLHLKGLGARAVEILRQKGLRDEESWPELISLYRGHPCWLNIIAATILELFNGSVSRFLAEKDSDIFIGDLEPLLASHLERLSDLEIKASNLLASQAEAVDIARPSSADLCKSELWQAIQSLGRRGLVEKAQLGERAMFQLNPVFKQYIQSK